MYEVEEYLIKKLYETGDTLLYGRVSTDPQKETGFSIPAQIKLGEKYAKEKGLKIVKVFTESMTASEEGRVEFNNMLAYAKKHSNIKHIIVEQVNRFTRNESDTATIIKLAEKTDLNMHIIKDNLILNKNSTSADFILFNILATLAASMSRGLKYDVKKAMLEKACQGYYPSRAPIGYKNKRKSKKVSYLIIDTEKSPYIKRAFELYSTGIYSYETLAKKLANEGFKVGKKPCYKKNIADILNNTIYMGEFDWKGYHCYEAKHEPIISKELFYAVQKVIKDQTKPKLMKHNFLYSGLINCAHCGCQLVGLLAKGKYEYYHCTGNRGGDCKKKYISVSIIDKYIDEILKSIYIPPDVITRFLDTVKRMFKEKNDFEMFSLEESKKQIQKIKRRIDNLYIDKLDGVITEEFFKEKSREWHAEIAKYQIQEKAIFQDDKQFIDNVQMLFELCKNPSQWYYRQSIESKRQFLKLICLNFTYDGENLIIELKSALRHIVKSAYFLNGTPKGI